MQTRIITLIAWACVSGVSLFGCSGGDDSSGTTNTGGSTGTGGTPGTGGGGGSSTGTGGVQSTGCYTAFSYSGYTPGATARKFGTDVYPILLQANCALSSSCHMTPAAQHPYLGPNTPSPSAAVLAGIVTELTGNSAEATGVKIVATGDPANSWLMVKLDEADPFTACNAKLCPSSMNSLRCGTSMPQGAAPLSAANRGIIRDWIAQGAQQ